MLITAVEKGRNLLITLGDAEDNIQITVKPVNAKIGAALFQVVVGQLFGAFESVEESEEAAGGMSRMAIGEENWPIVENDLRSEEANAVINAALMWNVQGGGMDLVKHVLEGDIPKAHQLLSIKNGFGERYSNLLTLIGGGEETETQSPDVSSGTSTTPNTSDSSALSKLPAHKRSINQNQDAPKPASSPTP